MRRQNPFVNLRLKKNIANERGNVLHFSLHTIVYFSSKPTPTVPCKLSYELNLVNGLKKQENNETIVLSRIFFFFLVNNFITTNMKEVKFCFSLLIGPNRIVEQENNNILVSLFSCF